MKRQSSDVKEKKLKASELLVTVNYLTVGKYCFANSIGTQQIDT
jgi:hypothetical protein